MTKLPTVEETKIQVAAEYGCENYEHDYEFGLGTSKLMDPFEFMERVCESHTAAHTAGLEAKYKEAYWSAAKYAEESVRLRKRVKELEAKIASYESAIEGLKKVVDSLYNLKS